MTGAGTSPCAPGEAAAGEGGEAAAGEATVGETAVDGPAVDGPAVDGPAAAEAEGAAPGRTVPAPRLDERSREILAFERRWWRHPGAKEQAIRDTFGLPVTRYYQLLNALLDEPAALAHDPVLVGRLRRLRDRRSRPG